MTSDHFEQIVNDQFRKCREILTTKAKEYAREDRLSNFKKAAHLIGCTPEKALWGMAIKHIVSITDFINDHENGFRHSIFEWDEKTSDIINYLLLLRGILCDEYEKDNR